MSPRASARTGGTPEIEIPFKTLKFGPEGLQTWGINFQRRLRRKNENSYWSPLRRIHQLSRVSMAGTYEGLQGLRPGANVRVKPYALANFNQLPDVNLDRDYDAGFDVKYGVTSGLTWDFTVNTDFSQVEADEQQVNLTRFNLFFPKSAISSSRTPACSSSVRATPAAVVAAAVAAGARTLAGHDLLLQPPDRPVAGRRCHSAAGRHPSHRARRASGRSARSTSSSARKTAARPPTSRRCGRAATSSPTRTSA